MTSEELQSIIAASLPCEHLDVSGDGSHWYATLVSSAFEGLSRIERHRRANATVGNRIQSGEVHALSMKTYTPAEWVALKAQ
jgi:acid stress-induced BolA-like protein IbaG/YrbA